MRVGIERWGTELDANAVCELFEHDGATAEDRARPECFPENALVHVAAPRQSVMANLARDHCPARLGGEQATETARSARCCDRFALTLKLREGVGTLAGLREVGETRQRPVIAG
ncbi:hypothetical protein GCM10027267_05160 [Paramicrobacterium agarici]